MERQPGNGAFLSKSLCGQLELEPVGKCHPRESWAVV